MAPRVQFYHNTPDRLALVRELVASAWQRGRKLAIRCADTAQLKRLDQSLWTAEPLSFIPHVAIDSPLATETPVILAAPGEDSRWPHTDLLFNLADGLPPGHEHFRMLIEIVGKDEAEKHAARQRWASYRQHGYELKAFDAELRVAL